MTRATWTVRILIFIFSFFMVAGWIAAMPPSDEAIEKWKSEGILEEKLAERKSIRIVEPDRTLLFDRDNFGNRPALSDDTVFTQRVLVILVDFPDYRYDQTEYWYGTNRVIYSNVAAEPHQFDSLLFTDRRINPDYNPTGSMTDFYVENSYGKYNIEGDVVGWYTMPKAYWRYVLGDYTRQLADDAVDSAEANGVDFSLYRKVYPSFKKELPGVIIVHAGPGAESHAWGIWSHKSSLEEGRYYDTTGIYYYTIQPEELGSGISSMAVFCHEWGHIMGLPDLYDVADNPGSEGLGDWSMMASGSWNGGGRTPSHFDAWCKFALGFVDVTWHEDTIPLVDAQIPQIESEPVIYGLKETPETFSEQFWLVENRQQVGFDAAIPGNGLCIYHVDYSAYGNTNPDHYMVALEQADGLNEMAYNGSQGDRDDPWPGDTDNRNFHDYSIPNARTYTNDPTQVGVWDISDSDSLMTADLEVYYSKPMIVLAGDSITVSDDFLGNNVNGILEPGETIKVFIEVENLMRAVYHPGAKLIVNTPGVDLNIITDSVKFDGHLISLGTIGLEEPLVFEIPPDFEPAIVSFTIKVSALPTYSGPFWPIYHEYFDFEVMINPQIMLVDDDNGDDYQSRYINVFDRMHLPVAVWDKSTQSSPTSDDLDDYEVVFWMTGSQGSGGTLTASDVAAMEGFLQLGGNLCLSTLDGTKRLDTINPAFMAEYLHADYDHEVFRQNFLGLPDNPVGDGLRYALTSGPVTGYHSSLIPVNGGEEAFILTNYLNTEDSGSCGVTFDGLGYRTVFLTFAIEFLNDEMMHADYMPKDTLLNRILTFFDQNLPTDVEDDHEPPLAVPAGFVLEQNYPNPFNPATSISYMIGAGKLQRVNLSVFNILGQNVVTLVDRVQGPGRYTVGWNGTARGGHKVASGTYFYRLSRGDQNETQKMLLLK